MWWGKMSTDHRGLLDHSIPQWKRDLILRRRAVGRVLPAGSGSVQLTCPSVVAALRYPEHSVGSCPSEREQAAARKNMRLVEQVNTAATPGDFADSGVVSDFRKNSKSGENVCGGKNYFADMGEEKNCVKKKGSGESRSSSAEKKRGHFPMNDEDSSSDSSEELKYGPGIVSRLKSRYLSLTLRENQNRSRPTLPYMRRATSLENILDGPEDERCEETKPKYVKSSNTTVPDRCRSITRGNKDSMKRAASVETLIRGINRRGGQYTRSYDIYSCSNGDESDQRKLVKNTISSVVEGTDLPPPDVVKHTLKIFENSSNLNKNYAVSKTSAKISSENSNHVCAKKPTIFPKPGTGVNSVNKCSDVNAKSAPDPSIHRNVSEVNGKVRSGEVSPGDGGRKRRQLVHAKDVSCESAVAVTVGEASNGEVAPAPEDKPKQKTADVTDSDSYINNNVKNNVSNNNNHVASNKHKSNGLASPDLTDHGNGMGLRISQCEPIRSISPVLVRAPPCILSSEISHTATNQQQQQQQQHHMKQLGVVRPIITNKAASRSGNRSHTVLTEREIEKNLINSVKSIEQPVTKVIVSLKKSPEECIVSALTGDGKQHVLDENNVSSKKEMLWDPKKPNTMVFNFSNRKSVPDYIENDGLILTSRKDKPKRGEPGIIFLGGGTADDSSTDFDGENFMSDPPSPCDFTFEGDNILINGKSNIQSKPKLRKMKIQFNDEATTTFEYPSEASLLDEHDTNNVATDGERNVAPVNGNATASGLANPFRCSSLASYTPSKLSLSADFQLGVTRTPAPPPPRTEPTAAASSQVLDLEEEYLRPADESSTVTWSSETAADLLF